MLPVVVALVVTAVLWLWLGESLSRSAADYEECIEQVDLRSVPKEGGAAQCGVLFAGRRKPGGGYTYYDFMQNKSFDIAGPNPSAEELKEIDRQYMAFLDEQRRDAVSSDLAKRRTDQLEAELERTLQPVGPPIIITPRNPNSAGAARPADRSKLARCDDGSLSCSWARFSAAMRRAFASSAKTKP